MAGRVDKNEIRTCRKKHVRMDENELSYQIIGLAMRLHSNLGPGLLESAYEFALAHDLRLAGLEVRKHVPVSFDYNGVRIEHGYKMDLLINDKVILELKSVEAVAPVHYAQVLTYLRLSGKKLGLLINFNEKHLRNGIHRIVNNL